MDRVAVFLDALTTSHWIAVVSVAIAAISLYFNWVNYVANRRERRLRLGDIVPLIKGTINAKRYEGGWRSVNLHIIGPANGRQDFKFNDWIIERASLLRPSNAVLARAKDDDYATGIFYPGNPVRKLTGKVEGRLQRFALEFFIKFEGEDKGQRAKFKVTFSRTNTRRRQRTARIWVAVPPNAE